jgi:DNA-binding response OmpR family regulator
MRLLVIEDNPDIVANLHAYLEPLGYRLDYERNGNAGLAAAARGAYDAIVLDLMLPGLDGIELCRRLRRDWHCHTPLLMLTARDTIADKVSGFESGADDYLVKPFSMAELDVRLKALVRRSREGHDDLLLQVGDLRFDRGAMKVWRAGRPVELTPSGYRLLARLMLAAPNLVSREVLSHELWGDSPPESDALRTHIHALRQAIDKPFATALLQTRSGQGYRLQVDGPPPGDDVQ